MTSEAALRTAKALYAEIETMSNSRLGRMAKIIDREMRRAVDWRVEYKKAAMQKYTIYVSHQSTYPDVTSELTDKDIKAIAILCGRIADAMIAEDEQHAKENL